MPIPENEVQFVHLGDQMQVRVDAIGRSFTAKIVRFTRDVNVETRTRETEPGSVSATPSRCRTSRAQNENGFAGTGREETAPHIGFR
jgi:hypothetical protein